MSAIAIQSLIGTALTDSNFRLALLNGSRRRVLQNFALTKYEVETIMAIRADSLEQLAGEIHRRLLADADELAPLPAFRAQPTKKFQPDSIWMREQPIDSPEPTPAWSH